MGEAPTDSHTETQSPEQSGKEAENWEKDTPAAAVAATTIRPQGLTDDLS